MHASKRTVSVLVTAIAAACLFAAAQPVRAVTIWANELISDPNHIRIITFDSASPQTVTVIGSAGIGGASQNIVGSGLEFDAAGNLYMSTFSSNTVGVTGLYSINKGTGAATALPLSGIADGYSLQDLSWDPANNRMLALAQANSGAGPVQKLYSIDLTTAAATDLGDLSGFLGLKSIVGLATDLDGTNYVYEIRSSGSLAARWYVLNGLVATPLDFVPFYSTFQQGGTIHWGGDGTLYHGALNNDTIDAELWTIDKTNGAATFLGAIGTNLGAFQVEVGDIAIAPPAVPEPASAAFALIGLGGGLIRRRRHAA